MNGKALIISQSRNATAEYAVNSLGLQRGEYEHVATVSQVRNARKGEIHLAPSWDKHPQRFAIKAALRYVRPDVEVILYAPEGDVETVEVDELGLTAEERAIYEAVVNPTENEESDESTGEAVEGEDVEETPQSEPDNRRRRRCKTCGELIHPDDLEEHTASHGGE